MSTDIELAPAATLFRGSTPQDLIDAATEVATRFSDIVRSQRLYQQIAGRQHVLIEGWQTVGTLVGVFAVKDEGVTQLPWPSIAALGEQPEDPGREPPRSAPNWPEWDQARTALARWEHHRDLLNAQAEGLAFGFTASFRAVKDGNVIGWGEGRCDRSEWKWTTRDDYALESMAQTRGQSRTLAAPLRFIVKLAGYATTPAEEVSGDDGGESERQLKELEARLLDVSAQLTAAQARGGALLDLGGQGQVVKALEDAWPMYDAVRFVTKLEKRFEGQIPDAAGAALRAWAWFAEQPTSKVGEGSQEGSQSAPEGAALVEPESTPSTSGSTYES